MTRRWIIKLFGRNTPVEVDDDGSAGDRGSVPIMPIDDPAAVETQRPEPSA
jgi:hypothetical protein